MPDENGVCRCGGTGADGCVPTVRVPSAQEIRLDRRTRLYRELLAQGPDLVPITEEAASTAPSTGPQALAARGGASLAARPARSQLGEAGPNPLLRRAARRDPQLAALLEPGSPAGPPGRPHET